jgi:hypothetical protein
MATWWATSTSQQEACYITSSRFTASSLRSTSRSTLNTCTGLGIFNSRLSPCSIKFKIVLTILRQGGVLIGHPQQISVGYATIFATGHFISACRQRNERHTIASCLEVYTWLLCFICVLFILEYYCFWLNLNYVISYFYLNHFYLNHFLTFIFVIFPKMVPLNRGLTIPNPRQLNTNKKHLHLPRWESGNDKKLAK